MKYTTLILCIMTLLAFLSGLGQSKVFSKKLKFKATTKTDYYWLARFAFTNSLPLDFKIAVRFIKPYSQWKKLHPDTKVYILAINDRNIERHAEALDSYDLKTYNGTRRCEDILGKGVKYMEWDIATNGTEFYHNESLDRGVKGD